MAYFYQHSEGQIIQKPDRVVDMGGGPFEYFSGPFCKSWWIESDWLQPLPVVRDALGALGLGPSEINQLGEVLS